MSSGRSHTMEESQRLHQAIARYSVMVCKMGRPKRTVAADLTYTDAKAEEERWEAKIAAAEPHLAGRMCRSVTMLQLTNSEEVARVLGYGPDFDYERACAALEAYMADKQSQEHEKAG